MLSTPVLGTAEPAIRWLYGASEL